MPLCLYLTNGLVSTIAPDHQIYILQLHLTSSHAFIICLLSTCMSVTVSSFQQSCLIHFHLQAFIFVIAVPNHLCCLLHLQQTSIVVMIVTIAQDEQICILTLHPTSSQDGNEHLQHTYLLRRIFVLIYCTS